MGGLIIGAMHHSGQLAAAFRLTLVPLEGENGPVLVYIPIFTAQPKTIMRYIGEEAVLISSQLLSGQPLRIR
ncbi:hypothetical protein CPT76_10340 [Paenibacillus sp. AR247]|nr:hypothetical protein CPT76_10340 [Paenibacillus sp. AR247]